MILVGKFPCPCAEPTPELVEVSLEPEMVRASTIRCARCGETFVSRSKPMKFLTISEADLYAEGEP